MLASTMSEFRGIPVVTTGTKYQTEQGFAAIKNGVKARVDRQQAPREPKPSWLKARVPSGERFERLRATVREHRLATVCEESICPNIGECWNNGTATIMLMGKVCTDVPICPSTRAIHTVGSIPMRSRTRRVP
jgi:lipoic acid synthetase